MQFGQPDRPPLFDEGQRKEVLATWRHQGMPDGALLSDLFAIDERHEIEPDLYPSHDLDPWLTGLEALDALQDALDPHNPARLPADWDARVRGWRDRQQTVMLRVHRGFFQSIGVQDWRRFYQAMLLVKDQPRLVRKMLEIQGEFNARITERVLRDVHIDAAVFGEPIGDNNGPLISPRTYRELVLPTYQPVFDVLNRCNVRTIILRAYANVYRLLPDLLKAGINCLWVVEVRAPEMDYRRLRREFGGDLRLIGGIDLDVLREGQESIRREMEVKARSLLEQGGYAPLLDGRVRQDITWGNYCYYRELLERLCARGVNQ
ncbi:MAG: uroporphyrinogen decarboxylase family protein [Anaerolineales bacterium]